MNRIYIGDRQLEPDEQEEPCAKCGNRHCDRLCDDPDEPNDYPDDQS